MINHASVFKILIPDELKILRSIENGMKKYEWVPVEEMASHTSISKKEIEYRLHHLVELDLVERYIQSYVGYQLKFNGYDILAIDTLVRKDIIHALGDVIGVGKESIILAAMSNGPVAIKFHREGRTSFKQVKRAREHLLGVEHFNWLYGAKLAAVREFEVMNKLYPTVNVPQPFEYTRHAIVMGVAEGVNMVDAKLVDPEWYLEEILKQIKLAYGLGFIHGDLSEYNVMVSDKGITLIDWPQYVTAGSKTAEDMIRRDVGNILTYFDRKYRIKRDLEEVLKYIKDEP